MITYKQFSRFAESCNEYLRCLVAGWILWSAVGFVATFLWAIGYVVDATTRQNSDLPGPWLVGFSLALLLFPLRDWFEGRCYRRDCATKARLSDF